MIMEFRKGPIKKLALALMGSFFLLCGLLALLRASHEAWASPPIEGNPLSFGSVVAVFTPTQDVLCLTLAYFDADGYPDLAFSAGGAVQIAANTGHPFTGWLAPVTVGSGLDRVNAVLAADLDRDARTDLVALSGQAAGGQVRLWRNPGDPFGTAWSEGGSVAQSAIITYSAGAAGDLDGDAAPDLIAGSSDGILRLWRNPMAPGDPFTADWGTPQQIATASGPPRAVELADLNQDGYPDLLALDGNVLKLWENPGDPFNTSWTTSVTLNGLGNELHSLFVTDLDGDGRPDPAVGDAAGNLLVWANPLTPGQPFDESWPAPVGLGSLGEPLLGLAGRDFDHDGWVDLAVGGGGATHAVQVWRNPGTLAGSWDVRALGTRADAVYALVAADADADGDADVIAGSDAGDSAQVIWWPNTLIHRDAPFPETTLPVGESSSDIEALARGDLNRDGWLDLVSGNASGEIVIWENDGQPMQGAWSSHLVSDAHGLLSLALGDLDGDGDLEIVSGHESPPRLLIWQNQGTLLDGPWVSSEVGDPGAGIGGLALADLDLDGWPDIATGSGVHLASPSPDHKVTVWHNDGTPFDGLWAFIDTAVITYSINAVAVGDLDLDNWPDIVIGTDHAPGMGSIVDPVPRSEWADVFQVQALRNPGTPFSTPWTTTIVGRDPATVTLGPEEDPNVYHGFWGAGVRDVKLADFDRDGDLDIVTADGIEADYQVKVWENDGTPFDEQPRSFHWTWQPIAVWYGQPPSPPWMGGSALSLDVADFNLDGWPDVVPGVTSWLWLWFENNGTPFGDYITDTHWVRHASTISSVDIRALAAEDYDRDGDADVAFGLNQVSGHEVGLWPNLGGGVAYALRDTGSSPMQQGTTDDLLRIKVTHNGAPDEDDMRLAKWYVRLTDSGGSPLSSAQANALVETMWVYLDTGNGKWTTADTQVITVTDLTLDPSGYQTLLFDDLDPSAVVSPGQTRTYFVVIESNSTAMYQTPNALEIWFDADQDSLAQEVTSGASVAVDDAEPFGSGVIQFVGAATHVLIEDAPNGTGHEVGDDAVASGYSLDLFAVARDELEQYVSNASVTWTLTTLSGGVAPGDLVPSGDSTWARLNGHLTGTARISIEHATLGNDSTGIITVAPAPAQMVLSADPPEVVVAEGVTSTLRASLQDAGGAPVVDGIPVTFTIESGGDLGSLPASPYVAHTAGGQAVAVFTGSTENGQVVFSAATGGLTEYVSVTLRPGPLASLQIEGHSTGVFAGRSLQWGPRVTALDSYGNIKTDYTGSVYFSTSDPQATLSITVDAPYTFVPEDQGTHRFDGDGFIFGTAGYQVITVTDGSLSASGEPIQVHPGLETGSIKLTLSSQEVLAGQSVTCMVEAFDPYGNSRGDWTPWCDYSIEPSAQGEWNGNVYTSERDGRWHITASDWATPQHTDTVELRVVFVGHRVYLPLVLRNH